MARIAKYHTNSGPFLNLPAMADGKHPEGKFCKKFARTFADSMTSIGVGLREFDLSGCGIADFLWVQFTDKPMRKKEVEKITAFEVKLKDWKKGIAQAYRYSYFADMVYLVLPEQKISSAMNNNDLFNQWGIGLYGFNEESKEYSQHIEAHDNGPRNKMVREKALKQLSRELNLSFSAQ